MRQSKPTKNSRPPISLRKILLAAAMAAAAVIILVSGCQIVSRQLQAAQSRQLAQQLRTLQPTPSPAAATPIVTAPPTPSTPPPPASTQPPTPSPQPEVLAQYQAHLQQYPDFAGWLRMPALTGVDYPVVQSTDNEYYLTRDVNENASVYGAMFMDYRNGRMELSDNTILYGHNMRDGAMLGQLKKYKNADFALSEPARTLTFDTAYHQYTWKVFAIYLVDITTYLDFYRVRFKDEVTFDAYIGFARTHSMVDYSDVPVEYGDKLLSLYTCDAAGDDYRLILHAVLVEEDIAP